ncbi:hypothetical protein WME73_43165 [Sorangium sp. So ce302]|uniref:hypothetical protein n=1 Tax=Sorangium sp. So ce302 TaxID=3133297 RepID=UPI003F5F83D1
MPSTRRQPNQKPETQAKKPGTSVRQPFLTEDAEVAFHHFRSIVAQTPEDDLDPWTGDALIVRLNATRGVDALRPHEARLREALPLLRFDELLEQAPRAARQSPPRRPRARRPRPRRPRSRSTPDVPPATPRPVLR